MRLLKFLFLFTLVAVTGCENPDEARRKEIANNMKQLGLALHAYQAANPRPADISPSTPSDEAPLTPTPKTEDKANDIVEPRPSVPE